MNVFYAIRGTYWIFEVIFDEEAKSHLIKIFLIWWVFDSRVEVYTCEEIDDFLYFWAGSSDYFKLLKYIFN